MFKAYVFDAYGTLFDVHAAVRRHSQIVGDGHELLSEIWRTKQLEYTWTRTLIGRYLDFWDLTKQALDYAFERVPTTSRSARQSLLDAYWELDCFDEVPDVLRKLKAADVQCAILSNGSTDMLNAAVQSAAIGEHLDHVISVDRLKRFKAVPEVYQMVVDDMGITPADVSFQSSNRWDVAAAAAFGFRAVWCNRGGMPDEYLDMAPEISMSNLNGLLDESGLPI